MNRKIKLIWDFFGDDAEKIAQHHKIHLAEYAKNKKLLLKKVGIEEITKEHCIAYLITDESEVFSVRDALKPVRAEIEA